MPSFVGQLFRFILKLVLGLLAAVFAVSLLLLALVVLAFSVLKALITGKKPAPAMVFGRFQKFSPQGMWPGQQAPSDTSKGEIVDVEVREVRDDKRIP